MFVLIAYDVPAKRTNLYRKLLKEFLVHEQASVFMGDLPESDVVKLVSELSQAIEPSDQVLKLVSRNRHNIEIIRLSKDAAGGPMRQEKDRWHGHDWSVV